MGTIQQRKLMEYLKIKEKNLELTVTSESHDCASVIYGGYEHGHTWDEYLANFRTSKRIHFNMIRKAIEELDWVGMTGEEMANDVEFVFSDGVIIAFTWRAWGDLMAAIVGKGENYLSYYM